MRTHFHQIGCQPEVQPTQMPGQAQHDFQLQLNRTQPCSTQLSGRVRASLRLLACQWTFGTGRILLIAHVTTCAPKAAKKCDQQNETPKSRPRRTWANS